MTHLIDPDGNITEYPAILREIEMPQGLFDLLEGANRLELLLPGVLLQVVKDSKHVGKPQGFDLEQRQSKMTTMLQILFRKLRVMA